MRPMGMAIEHAGKSPRVALAALCVASLVAAAPVAYADNPGKKPYHLARDSGCLVCHDVESPPHGAQTMLPLAPSFEQIAYRYRANPDAVDKLSSIVRDGSGPLRRDRHWDGKARFDRMYPNDTSEAETRAIVEWILTLAPAKAPEHDRRAPRARPAAAASRS